MAYATGTVAGGYWNTAGGWHTVVSGGKRNWTTGMYSSVAGGLWNTAAGNYNSVAGGGHNTAGGTWSSIGGGAWNTASMNYNTISGGQRNWTKGTHASVGGGSWNTAGMSYDTISGGQMNMTTGMHASIGGGYKNMAYATGTVAGGYWNKAGGWHTVVSGGKRNWTTGMYSSVAGGLWNTAAGNYNSVNGGGHNTAGGTWSSIGGGAWNTAAMDYNTIAGGQMNWTRGKHAAIVGGYKNTAWTTGTVGGGYWNTAGGWHTVVSGGRRNWTTGMYSSVAGGLWNTAAGNYNSVAGGGHNTAGGTWSSVGGGAWNTAAGNYVAIAGGQKNNAFGSWTSVTGGKFNTATANYSSILGGMNNGVTGMYSTILGGNKMTITSNNSIAFNGSSSTAYTLNRSSVASFMAVSMGVGTTNPKSTLEVVARSAEAPLAVRTSTSGAVVMQVSADGWLRADKMALGAPNTALTQFHLQGAPAAAPMLVNTGAATQPSIFVSSSGKVGIGTAVPHSRLMISGGALCVATGTGTQCVGKDTPGNIYASASVLQGADYAEYFAKEGTLLAGDVVGINPLTGKVRQYQKGDTLLGVVSTEPGIVGNADRDDENHVLVALMGQVPVNEGQVVDADGAVYTQDGQKLGSKLSDGRVFVNVSSSNEQAELMKVIDSQGRQIDALKQLQKTHEHRLQMLERQLKFLIQNQN